MSMNLPAGKPEAKPAQSPTPGVNPDKAGLKPNPGTCTPESDPKREADKPEPKKFQK